MDQKPEAGQHHSQRDLYRLSEPAEETAGPGLLRRSPCRHRRSLAIPTIAAATLSGSCGGGGPTAGIGRRISIDHRCPRGSPRPAFPQGDTGTPNDLGAGEPRQARWCHGGGRGMHGAGGDEIVERAHEQIHVHQEGIPRQNARDTDALELLLERGVDRLAAHPPFCERKRHRLLPHGPRARDHAHVTRRRPRRDGRGGVQGNGAGWRRCSLSTRLCMHSLSFRVLVLLLLLLL